jgi:hypothetical protein
MYDHVNSEEQHHLLKLLQTYEHLIDGALGEFNMDPISLQFNRQRSQTGTCLPIYCP